MTAPAAFDSRSSEEIDVHAEIVGSNRPHVELLPLWLTIKQAYGSYLSHFPDVLRATAPWLVMAPLATGGVIGLQVAMLPAMLAGAAKGGTPIVAMLLVYGSHIVLDVALVSIAVAWHRHIIIGERPAPLDVHLATGRFWRYVSICLALFCISFVMMSVLTVPLFAAGSVMKLQLRPGFDAVVIIGVAAAMSIAIGATCRLLPLLPAQAIDDRTLTFRKVWQRTRGSTWRLFWGTLACSALPVLPTEIAAYIVVGSLTPGNLFGPASATLIIVTAISTACRVLTMPILAGFLSYAYRHFFGRPSLAGDQARIH